MELIFKNISFLEQKKLLKILEMGFKTFKEGDVVPMHLNRDFTGIIISGFIEISKIDYNGRRIITEELVENGIFGNAFSSNNKDELTITAKEESLILFLDYDNVVNFENPGFKYYNQFIKNLLDIINKIIIEKNDRIEILTKKTIRDKLLEYFLISSKKHGSRIIYLPFSYTDLADYLSVDRSALSRELNNLKKEGFINTKGRKIILENY